MRTMKLAILVVLLSLACAADPLQPGDAASEDATADAVTDSVFCEGLRGPDMPDGAGFTIVPCAVPPPSEWGDWHPDDASHGTLPLANCYGGGHENNRCIVQLSANDPKNAYACVAACGPF